MLRIYSLTFMCLSEIIFIFAKRQLENKFLDKIQLKEETGERIMLRDIGKPIGAFSGSFCICFAFVKERLSVRSPV